jgi:hypothetical protein
MLLRRLYSRRRAHAVAAGGRRSETEVSARFKVSVEAPSRAGFNGHSANTGVAVVSTVSQSVAEGTGEHVHLPEAPLFVATLHGVAAPVMSIKQLK